MLDSMLSGLVWLVNHSGLTSLVALILAVLSALFDPPTWRRVMASLLVALGGMLFLPYRASDPISWSARATVLAVAFVFAFWYIVGRYNAWRVARNPLPAQPSGTFEAIVDSVRRFKGNSNVSVHISTTQGTMSITKTATEKK